MTRPRIAAVVSAAAASTAAFLVVSRWGLFGTVAGTVVFTMIHTVVSHWSAEGLDHVVGRVRRSKRGKAAAGVGASDKGGSDEGGLERIGEGAVSSLVSTSERRESLEFRKSRGRFSRTNVTQWLLAASAVVAVGFSIYAVTSPPVQQTLTTVVYRDQVVERTVTVTTEAPQSAVWATQIAQADDFAATPTSTTVSSTGEDTGADQSTSTAEPTDTSAQEPVSSSTTAATANDDTGTDGSTLPSTDGSGATVDTTARVPGTVTTPATP